MGKDLGTINMYPDGSTYFKLNSSLTISQFDNICSNLIIRINSYEDLWKLSQMVECLNDAGRVPNIYIPWLIDSQADRRFNKRESFSLKLVIKFLCQINANFKIFHPHNAEVVKLGFEMLEKKVEIIYPDNFISHGVFKDILGLHSVSNNRLQYYSDNVKKTADNLVVIIPDAGASKWLNPLLERIGYKGEIVQASKKRKKGNIANQTIPIMNFEGKDVLVIDDMCINGGTFKGISKILDLLNVGKKYLAVSHMILKDLGKDPVTNYFDEVYTTDSRFAKSEYKNINVFEMFKNAKSFEIDN